MKKFRNLLLVVAFISGFATSTHAGHPDANFGIYGIQHLSTVAQYQQTYVGQVVQYIPMFKEGGFSDDEYFKEAGGKYNTDYIISKISGSDKRMTWVLIEKGTKNKVKMIINNQDEGYSFGKYFYCITDTYSVPLLLSDNLNSYKENYIGKIYPNRLDCPIKLEVTDIIMQRKKGSDYPHAYIVMKDQADGKIYNYDVANTDNLNDLGKVFTNTKYKCSYTVVNVYKKEGYDYGYHKANLKYYTVKNSIDGSTKEVRALYAEKDAFEYDDSGKFVASLSKVEKPSNSAVRYGKTTSVTEKDITKYSYEDNFINILIFAGSSQFNFILKNVSTNTVKVVWNEAVFVDVDGSTSKVMHSGIKYSQREGDQPASTIIKGAKLEDLAAPTDKVYYDDVLKEWSSKSLYSNADPKLEGQTIKLMLPIQVKDVVNEYIFEFKLNYVYNHPEYLAD